MRYINLVPWIIAIVLSFILWKQHNCIVSDKPMRDTIFLYDTIVKRVPVPVEMKPIKTMNVRLKLLGSIASDTTAKLDSVDSVTVELPITQKVYEDSTYKAYVSGYEANLDSIYLYQPTRYITITTEPKRSKWSWGLQGGIGITPKGIQPYLGIGGQFTF